MTRATHFLLSVTSCTTYNYAAAQTVWMGALCGILVVTAGVVQRAKCPSERFVMPQRFLRPGIRTSGRWNRASFIAQSLYISIMTMVDDFGRYDARPRLLHGECFSLRDDVKPQQTAAALSELATCDLIQLYEFEGKEYLQVLQWHERARSEASKFPDPPQHSAGNRSIPQEKDASLAISPRHKPSPEASASKARPKDENEVVEFCCSEGLPASDGRSYWNKWQGNGHKNGGDAIKDWRSTIRHHKEAGYLPSQKRNGTHQRNSTETGRGLGTANEGKSAQYEGVGKVR